MSRLATSENSSFYLVSVAEQAGLNLTMLETSKTGFVPSRSIYIGPQCEKTCLRRFAKNKGTDQPAHTCSLISAFVIRLLESIISTLATSEILIF